MWESLPFDARLERLRFQAGTRLVSPLLVKAAIAAIMMVDCQYDPTRARYRLGSYVRFEVLEPRDARSFAPACP